MLIGWQDPNSTGPPFSRLKRKPFVALFVWIWWEQSWRTWEKIRCDLCHGVQGWSGSVIFHVSPVVTIEPFEHPWRMNVHEPRLKGLCHGKRDMTVLVTNLPWQPISKSRVGNLVWIISIMGCTTSLVGECVIYTPINQWESRDDTGDLGSAQRLHGLSRWTPGVRANAFRTPLVGDDRHPCDCHQ